MGAASNPFRSECVTALPFVSLGKSWEEMLRDLAAQNWRGSIVGSCGSGKTTLLERLMPSLEENGFHPHFIGLDTAKRHLPCSFWKRRWEKTDAVLLDGAEQLNPVEWQCAKLLSRKAGAMVLTSHSGGLLPTWVISQTTPALLLNLASRLGVELSEAEGEVLFERHNGDLRQCFFALYDDFGREKSKIRLDHGR